MVPTILCQMHRKRGLVANAPLPQLRRLHREHYASSELLSIRGAVVAWYVVRNRGLSALTAKRLAERLLSSYDPIRSAEASHISILPLASLPSPSMSASS